MKTMVVRVCRFIDFNCPLLLTCLTVHEIFNFCFHNANISRLDNVALKLIKSLCYKSYNFISEASNMIRLEL